MEARTSVSFSVDAASPPIVAPVVSEEMIDEVVRAFYGKARVNLDLGPIFEGAIDDWEPHLVKMVSFWSAVMLKTRRYKGSPMAKHNALSTLRPEHFEIWLGLFRAAARDVCPELIAEAFIQRAKTIGESLKLARFGMPRVPR